MIKNILIGLVVIVAGFAAFVATRPSHFHIERSAVIAAPASIVFNQVNNLHKWEAWSPWAKMDPAMKQSYEGPESGVGAVSAWSGNSKVGEGRMTITESKPNEFVRLNLEFMKPMKGSHTGDFVFKQEGNQTSVTWSMEGESNFVGRAMCVFVSMDKMVGGNFEDGLAQIKAVSEAEAAAAVEKPAPAVKKAKK